MRWQDSVRGLFSARRSRTQDVLWVAAVALTYFGTARLSLLLEFQREGIAAIWPCSGVFLSAMLLTRRDLRPSLAGVLCATDFMAEWLAGTPPLVGGIFALALTSDAVLGSWLILRFVGPSINLGRVRDVTGWLLLSVLLSNALTSVVPAAASMSLPGAHSFWTSWQLWAVSDGIGNLIVTPFVLGWASWARTRSGASDRRRMFEAVVLFGVLSSMDLIVFVWLPDHRLFTLFLPYVVFPFVTWAALRFEGRGAATAVLAVAVIAVQRVTAGRVPAFSFAPGVLDDVIVLQLFLAVVAVPAQLLAAVVAERRAAEAARAAGDDRFRRAIVQSPFPILLHAEDGTILQASRSWHEITGYGPEELRTIADWTERAYGERQGIVRADIDALYALDHRKYEGDYTIRIKDGTTRIWEFSSAPLGRLPDGRRLVMSMALDVTERRLGEERLRRSEEKYRDLVENINDVIFSIGLDGIITYVSPPVRQLAGFAPDELIGHPFAEVVHPDDVPGVAGKLLEVQKSQIGPWEFRYLTKDGRIRWARTSSRPILDGDRVLGIRGMLTDITNRKLAEEEHSKLEAQLRQAHKMESVGRLAGGVAHDFNNMLGVILGHAEMALEQVDRAQPLHADLGEIRKAAMRSADLARQLLAFAREQPIAPEVLDLNTAVTGTLHMLRRLIGEEIDLRWQPQADLWPILMDPSQIDQVLTNLCVNSRDAISGVGRITIETSRRSLTEEYCLARPGFTPGDYVMLAVSDDGGGMDKDVLSHVFEPFFTTKALGQGTGLGLATVYGIVKQNSGSIDVYSEPGRGTTVRIYLPRHMAGLGQGRAPGATPPGLRGHETILLVEDEAAILKLATRLLTTQGYTVLAAGTPGEAVRMASEHTGEIDLLMTDVVMPEMNGRELARKLLSRHPHLKCLFTSGYTADIIAHRGVLSDGVQFLQKPFSSDSLATKVREALDSGGESRGRDADSVRPA